MRPDYLSDDDEARDHPLVRDHNWILSIVKDGAERRLYDAVPPKHGQYFCPDCNEKAWLKDERWAQKTYVDLNRWGKHVGLRVLRRRFECPNPKCETRSFQEKLPELNHNRHLTRDLATEVIGRLRSFSNFVAIARDYGLDEQILRNLEKDFVAEQDALRGKNTTLRLPQQLGIHGARICKRDCCLLVNVATARPLEIIPSRNAGELVRAIEKLFDEFQFADVSLVAMSLDVGYRHAARTLFPRAKIIVPRFEVEAMANRNLRDLVQRNGRRLRLNKERRELLEYTLRLPFDRLSKQKLAELDKVFYSSPLLKAAYENKQSLIGVLSSPTKERGLARYKELSKDSSAFVGIEFMQELDGWQDAIFDALAVPCTNYFLQLEQLIAMLKKVGRAYSFETMRGRMLYGAGRGQALNTRLAFDEPDLEEQDVGVPIEVLIKYLKRELALSTPKNPA